MFFFFLFNLVQAASLCDSHVYGYTGSLHCLSLSVESVFGCGFSLVLAEAEAAQDGSDFSFFFFHIASNLAENLNL